MQPGDKFCGSCGAVALPPAPQAEKVVSEPPPRAQGASYAPRRRNRFWVNAAAISLLLLVSIGAVAALALSSGLSPFGSSDPRPADNPGGDTPTPREEAQNPEVASVSPDANPDPAFDKLLPTLRQRTDARIVLPAELPDELQNVAVDADASGDSYGILFLAEPTGNTVERYVHARDAGTLSVTPQSEARDSGGAFEATSVEEVELPDGTDATLRYMEPVREGGNYGPQWEGEFERDGSTYALNIPSADPSGEAARRVLSSMVPVEGSGGEVAASPEPNPDEEALEEFGYEYDEANRSGDWAETYAMLGEESQQQFTEEEWAEKQQALRGAEGPLSPLQSVSVDLPEGVSDTSGNVILYYQDGTSDTIVAGIPMAVTSEEEAGEPKRTLTEEEISYLEQVSTDGGTDDLAAQVEEAAGDYYRASGVGDWDYTYDALDSETKALFTRDEWAQKNQWFADQGETIYNIESATLDETAQEPLAEVAVRLTGEDGSSSIRTTYFVNEGGEWKHHFSEEERDLFGPGVPFEEWVDIQ